MVFMEVYNQLSSKYLFCQFVILTILVFCLKYKESYRYVMYVFNLEQNLDSVVNNSVVDKALELLIDHNKK